MVASRAQADRISGAAAMRALLADACWPSGPQEGPRLIPGRSADDQQPIPGLAFEV
jgi:hypothetical protein